MKNKFIFSNRIYILISLLFFSIIKTSFAYGAGTAFGTLITSTATISALNAETATGTVASTVQAVYGVATNTEPIDSNISAGGTRDYHLTFTNNGNKADVIRLNVGAQSFGAGAGTSANWTVTVDDTYPYSTPLTWNGGSTSANPAGDYATITLGPGAQGSFTIRITSTGTPSDGATMTVPISLQTTSTPAGKYSGLIINTPYGGAASAQRTVGVSPPLITTTVQGAVFSISKTAVIQAPSAYVTLLNGSSSAPVPGSKITYTITYSNSGTVSAANVVITDSIPTNTHYKAGSITTSQWGAQGDIATDGDKCDYNITNPGKITCIIGTVIASSPNYTIQYTVTID